MYRAVSAALDVAPEAGDYAVPGKAVVAGASEQPGEQVHAARGVLGLAGRLRRDADPAHGDVVDEDVGEGRTGREEPVSAPSSSWRNRARLASCTRDRSFVCQLGGVPR